MPKKKKEILREIKIVDLIQKLYATLDVCDESNDYSAFDINDYDELWKFAGITPTPSEERE